MQTTKQCFVNYTKLTWPGPVLSISFPFKYKRHIPATMTGNFRAWKKHKNVTPEFLEYLCLFCEKTYIPLFPIGLYFPLILPTMSVTPNSLESRSWFVSKSFYFSLHGPLNKAFLSSSIDLSDTGFSKMGWASSNNISDCWIVAILMNEESNLIEVNFFINNLLNIF